MRSSSKESKIKLDLIQGHLEQNLRDDKHNEKNTHQSSLFHSIQTDYFIQNLPETDLNPSYGFIIQSQSLQGRDVLMERQTTPAPASVSNKERNCNPENQLWRCFCKPYSNKQTNSHGRSYYPNN